MSRRRAFTCGGRDRGGCGRHLAASAAPAAQAPPADRRLGGYAAIVQRRKSGSTRWGTQRVRPRWPSRCCPRPVAAVRFEVTTPYGVALPGHVHRRRGLVELRLPGGLPAQLLRRARPGAVPGQAALPRRAVSPTFTIGDGSQLYRQLVDNAVQYFTSERDGPDVDSAVLGRQPANLTDENAYVYADPAYDSNDNLLGTLKKIGGPVDVSGGWFDAGGGYEKFAFTASYADALMLIAARDYPRLLPTCSSRRRRSACSGSPSCGIPLRKVLYAQVGIGNGNASNTIQGDYNFWFLPQQEDRMNTSPGGNPGRPLTSSSTGRCSRRRRPASRSARTWRAASPPTSPSAPSSPRALTRRRPSTCSAWPGASTRWRRPPTWGSSSPRSRTTTTRVPSGRATWRGARPRSRWPTRRPAPRPCVCARTWPPRPAGPGRTSPRDTRPTATPSTSTTTARSPRPNCSRRCSRLGVPGQPDRAGRAAG